MSKIQTNHKCGTPHIVIVVINLYFWKDSTFKARLFIKVIRLSNLLEQLNQGMLTLIHKIVFSIWLWLITITAQFKSRSLSNYATEHEQNWGSNQKDYKVSWFLVTTCKRFPSLFCNNVYKSPTKYAK